MIIRAITFDLDDTLWSVEPVIRRAELVMYQWLGEHYPEVTAKFSADALRKLRFQVARERPDLLHDLTSMRIESLKIVARACGYPEQMADQAFEVMWLARNQVTLFDDVLPSLKKLAERFILGAVTNGNADIHLVGLGHLLEFSVSAKEIGAAKPDPKIFQAAARKAKLPLEQMLHVGDDPATDVVGANFVGMKSVYLNRPELKRDVKHEAHAELNSLEQIEELLIEWDAI